MAKNALVKRLEKQYLPDQYDIFKTADIEGHSVSCCGLYELDGVDNIDSNEPIAKVYWRLRVPVAAVNTPAGLVLATSTTGPKPQLVRLGFQLIRKFRNERTCNIIYAYQMLAKDLYPEDTLAG
jgi:hypothetical protein